MSVVFTSEQEKAEFLQELRAHCTARRLAGMKEDEDRVMAMYLSDSKIVLDFNEPAAVPDELIQLRREIGVDIVKFYELIPPGDVEIHDIVNRWGHSNKPLFNLLATLTPRT